jgi:hypothetical protein
VQRSTLSEDPPRLWPRFTSPLHSPAVTARIGRVLGICFGVCFVTGMLSHYQYQPWHWLPEPSSPVWAYRVTQGVHVTTGIVSIPLLLVKLWSVYPNLFAWPPARNLVQAIERLSIAVLVSASIVELVTGLFNVLDWYPWPWHFVPVHRFLGYVVIGSLLLHIAVKLPIIREGLASPLRNDPPSPEDTEPGHGTDPAGSRSTSGLSRRGLLAAAGAGTGMVAATVVGQAFTPLQPIALLAPRLPKDGPLGVPINRTAAQAEVLQSSVAPIWRLTVLGAHSFDLDLAAFEALPCVESTFPLACVEGWSVSARWRGPRLLDLVRLAGGTANSRVTVRSLEQNGSYRQSIVYGPQVSRAILVTHLNATRITVDHGYPVRLIAPNRAGVLNTKWLTEIEVV